MEIESKLHLVDWIILSATLIFIVAYGTHVTRKNTNVKEYIKNVDLFMVATGINFDNDFYNIDPNKLNKLMNVIKNDGENYEHR